MEPTRRQRALRLLLHARPDDVHLCRDVESYCHAHASATHEYLDRVRRAAFNLLSNPTVGLDVLTLSDEVLARDTLVGRIQQEAHARQTRFQSMLEEKYESLNDQAFTAIVRCRRCGSEEVTWEEKQTRSADEGGTIFCSCTTCKNRWVTRQ